MQPHAFSACAVLLACCAAPAFGSPASELGSAELKGFRGAAKPSGTVRRIGRDSLRPDLPPGLPAALDSQVTNVSIRKLSSGDLLFPEIKATQLRGSYASRLERRVENPRFVSLMPYDEQSFQRMYGQTFTLTRKRQLERYSSDLAQVDPAASALSSEEEIVRHLTEADGTPILFFAHSEDAGMQLVLPSGARMDVKRLHALCERADRACLVLTCEGADFLIPGAISLSEGVEVLKSIRSWTASGKLTVGELRSRAITRAAERSQRPGAWAISSVAAISGTGYLTTHRFEFVKGPTPLDDGKSIRGLDIHTSPDATRRR